LHIEKNSYAPVYKVVLIREREGYYGKVEKNLDAIRIFENYFKNVDREHFVVLMLDSLHNLIGVNTVAIGGLSSAVISLREVFKPAILSNAAGIIVAHNHPGGAPKPSAQDIQVSKDIAKVGELLGIRLFDSIIIGYKKHFSMVAHGLLWGVSR
jgi:DNA repair protein RadC